MGIYDPKNPLRGLYDFLPPPPPPKNPLATLLGGTPPAPKAGLADLAGLYPFGGLAPSKALESFLGTPAPAPRPALPVAPVKRKAFFSFHFDDVMRVNVVRNAWKITHPDSAAMRSFYDSSLWERRKLEGDDALKRLIREGVSYTSAVCVLIGSETWLRRWVKYEIARAVIDGRGLLGVNSIRHHQTQTPHTRGPNPLDFMAVGKVQATLLNEPRYYLFEIPAVPNGLGGHTSQWHRYSDFTDPVKLPRWLRDPPPDYVMPLSVGADQYDYIAGDGHKNIGAWIDSAAQKAAR
jgi:MTH538 TIR-like domain (DUF1863)